MIPDPLDLRNCLCANVRQTDRCLTRVYDQALRPSGLTAGQFAMLSVLAHAGTLRVTDLARVMDMDQTTVTRNLVHLKKGGLVDAAPTEDKRTRAASLTDLGRVAHTGATASWSKAQTSLTSALGQERLARFLEDLSLIRGLLNPTSAKEA